MMIAVVRKTREIGLISALGGTTGECAACFVVQGFIIGVLGSTLGIPCSGLVLKFRNHIISIFVKLCGVEDFMLKFDYFANMPAKYGMSNILAIVIFAIITSCVVGVLPAIMVSKIKPSDALRDE
jgi:lipoprotein-releasing system permease protein